MTTPRVMVSSTFYDLRQVRQDLLEYLASEAGLSPLLSEAANFPVDPDATAIENCRRRVESEADILVLVVGGRYGSIDPESGLSVTRVEYLAARAKGVPIYVFVYKPVAACMPVWEKNPAADFGGVVDDARVFELLRLVQKEHSAWCHEFEVAGEIIMTLRVQFAHLLAKGLKVEQQLRRGLAPDLLRSLTPSALRLAIERPLAWEYQLFAEVVGLEIATNHDLRKDLELGVLIGAFGYLKLEAIADWMHSRLAEIRSLSAATDRVFNGALQKAFGEPGESGDVEMIVYCARTLARLHGEIIRWALRTRRVDTKEKAAKEALSKMQGLADGTLAFLEDLSPGYVKAVQDLREEYAKSGSADQNLVFKIGKPGFEEFQGALNAFTECLAQR